MKTPEPEPVKTGWLPTTREDWVLTVFAVLTIAAYLWNLGYSDLWNPNEGFYGGAVREMLESGNYLDIYHNYEPRFNKPPLLYWLIAVSVHLFGLTEFAVRLPSALAGLGTVFLVYRMGRLLDNRRTGIVAATVMAFSFQFVINARYASPAVTLTFFFTLTLYWFLKAYHQQKQTYLWLAYLALGLTVLTKGYPYIIVIGGIAGLYLLFQNQGRWRLFVKDLWQLKPLPGLLIVLIVGLSWNVYTYLKFGDAFLEVFLNETYRRAFTRPSGPKPFFYLEANTWGFIPYSLTFYAGLIYLVVTRFRSLTQSRSAQLGFSWFFVMLVIFTVAKGKIPTYFIQAHPGMSLLTAFFIMAVAGRTGALRRIFAMTYLIPGVLFTAAGLGFVYFFDGPVLLYPLALVPALLLLLNRKQHISYLTLPFFPFTSFLIAYLLFAALAFPFIEKGFRNYDTIGEIVKTKVPDKEIPLLLEEFTVHTLPFYAARHTEVQLVPKVIKDYNPGGARLALIRSKLAWYYGEGQVLWEGPLYDGSETRTLELILDVMREKRGEESRFEPFQLVYFPAE